MTVDAALARPPLSTHNQPHRVVIGFSNLASDAYLDPLIVVRGEGARVFDRSGADYIDASANFFSAAFGFFDAELIEAATAQMHRVANYSTAYHRVVEPVAELADRLAALVPIKNARIGFATSGSEANEFVLKFLLLRNRHRGEMGKRAVLSRWGSYHGSTLFTASFGGTQAVRDAYGIGGGDFPNLSQPDIEDFGRPGENADAFVARLIDELETTIKARGPAGVAAFIAEPVSISSGAAIPPPGYFAGVRQVLDRYGIPFIADEIITGFGRLGTRFGVEKFDVVPDVMTFAKGINSGFLPLAAYAISEDLYDDVVEAVRPSGFLMHGGTYHGNPVAAAVALKCLELYDSRQIAKNVDIMGRVLDRELMKRADHPLVRSVRRIGLVAALKFDIAGLGKLGTGSTAAKVVAAGMRHRLLIRVSGGSIIIGPPLVTTEAEIVELFRRFDLTLGDALDQYAREK
jgi:4-aminobutyrate---pyruvate transaminase